jgi:hypothetical protein
MWLVSIALEDLQKATAHLPEAIMRGSMELSSHQNKSFTVGEFLSLSMPDLGCQPQFGNAVESSNLGEIHLEEFRLY